MDQQSNSKLGPSNPREPRAGSQRQDTVLLSDAPEAAAPQADANRLQDSASAVVANPASGAGTNVAPNLGAASFAALSQRYDILGEAGHGSMGMVYKARDRETGEVVALKLLKPEIASDQAMMDRFKNELLFARKITHKNICRVYEFNRIAGLAYTSMEYVEGESLRSVLNRFGAYSVRKGTDVALQICAGLKEAHAQGIVHRDLKPENVMIDALGNVKVMDFGIARSMETQTRLTGSMAGTPAYMAPEQVAGKRVDYRTDIYSLGLMLYEMFTGEPAFRADNPVAVALKQMRESPRPPHEIEPTLPVGIERAILRCVEKEPEKRFQSVAELENALRSPSASAFTTAPAVAPSAARPRAQAAASPVAHPRVPLAAANPERKGASPFLWALLGAVLVLGGLAAGRSIAIAKSAKQLPPPVRAAAPQPPDFALAVPSVQPRAPKPAEAQVAEPAPTTQADANPPAESHPTVDSAETLPKPVAPGKSPAPESVAPPESSSDRPSHPAASNRELPPAAADQTYLVVGRFVFENRAQQHKKKVEALGIPAVIVTRHPADRPGALYVVAAGPFDSKDVGKQQQKLESAGFSNVTPIKASENQDKARDH